MWAGAQCLAADQRADGGVGLSVDGGGTHHVMRYDDMALAS